MKRNTSNIPQIQMVSPHQLHPLQFLKETDPEHLGGYTRRGLATVTHALLVLWNVACVVSIFCLILVPSLRGHNLEWITQTWKGVPPKYYLTITIVESLVASVLSVLVMISPEFLHRERKAVLLCMLPAIVMKVLFTALATYLINPIFLMNVIIYGVIYFGMLQGSNDNLLASLFVPFKKQ